MSSLRSKSGSSSGEQSRSSTGTRVYSQEEKDAFFAALDRRGSVSAAAAEVGLNRNTCFGWARKTAVPPKKPLARAIPKRKYTPEEKDQFFAVLDCVGNVTVAAAELGFNRMTCYQWAYKAGIANVRQGAGKREEFLRLRKAGATRREAAKAVAVHLRTGQEWDQGVKKSGSRRIYPDGRIVDYKRGVTTLNNLPGMARPDAASSLGLSALEKPVDSRFLSIQEREMIRDLRAGGSSVRAVAAALGRPASTVSRELARNSQPARGYQPYAAQRKAVARRTRPKPAKLAGESDLRDYVREKLLLRWSPEQISHTLVEEFPDNPEMRVSPETIYQALYVQARGGLKREIQAALRTGRTRRKPHRTGEQRTPRFIDPMIMISERPPEIEDRAVPGHWEGDLITGANNQSAIATLVERTTRYVMLVHLPNDHTAETVRDGLVKTMATLPAHLRGSLTWDQGAEMATHRSFTLATDMPVYFCDPASPWQRGSNENTNGPLWSGP